jgi:hypothetical protein
MNDLELHDFERRLAGSAPLAPIDECRAKTLAAMSRELRSARWDRRLAQTAAGMLVVGVLLNVPLAVSERSPGPSGTQVAQESILETAVTIAAATDAESGRRYALQLAALSGAPLTSEQTAALDAALGPYSRSN